MSLCRKARSNNLLVAAFDFGTTYSGYAFSFREKFRRDLPNISAKTAWSSSQGKASMKSDELELAPKPEAAGVFCITTDRMPGKSGFVNTFAPFENKRYVVLDSGGAKKELKQFLHECEKLKEWNLREFEDLQIWCLCTTGDLIRRLYEYEDLKEQRLRANEKLTRLLREYEDLQIWSLCEYEDLQIWSLYMYEDLKEQRLRATKEVTRLLRFNEELTRLLRVYEDLPIWCLFPDIDISRSRKLIEATLFRSDHFVLQDDADSVTRTLCPETMLETLKRISEGTRFQEQYSHRVVYKHKETASDFLKTMEDMKTNGTVKGKRKLSSQKREWHTVTPQEELFSEEDWTYILVYLEFLFQTNMKTNVTVWIDLVLARCTTKPGINLNWKRSVEDTFTKISDKTSSDVYSEKVGAEMKLKSALLKKSTVLCAEQSCIRQRPASRKSCNSMTSEENHSFSYESSCKICYGEEACVVFLPCSHMIACENCSSMLQHCAMCRSLIRGSFVVELNITI